MKPLNIVRNNIRQKARRCGVTESAMTQVYLQERLIARVAHSEYGRNLILKGAWCMKYILIPIGVAVSARILAEKVLRSQPDRQKNKRSYKNRLK